MNARHKDFNQYLVITGLFEALTDAFAKLFIMAESDRPENTVWFIQQCLTKDLPEDFPSWTEYQDLLRKLDNLKHGRPEDDCEDEKVTGADAADAVAEETGDSCAVTPPPDATTP